MKNANIIIFLSIIIIVLYVFKKQTKKYKMILPKGRITSKFGERIHPVTKKKSFHNGIDIQLPVGTPVLAPEDGIIDRVWQDNLGGIQMLFRFVNKSDNNTYTLGFAHLSKTLKKQGDTAKKGETIALTGNTGTSTGAHLHLTARINGKLIDPLMLYNNNLV